jgi:hypothetical protein
VIGVDEKEWENMPHVFEIYPTLLSNVGPPSTALEVQTNNILQHTFPSIWDKKVNSSLWNPKTGQNLDQNVEYIAYPCQETNRMKEQSATI